MEGHGKASSRADLLDVLEQLPRDVLRQGLWLQQHDGNTHLNHNDSRPSPPSRDLGRAFRSVCHRTRHLSDQLTRRLQLSSTAETCEANLPAHGAFLARQEALTELTLGADDQKAMVPRSVWSKRDPRLDKLIIDTLARGDTEQLRLRPAGSTCQRLLCLTLNLPDSPMRETGEAVQRHCLQLQEVCLRVPTLKRHFLQPLSQCLHLTKVCIQDWQGSAPGTINLDDAVTALVGLPHLRSVVLHGTMSAAAAVQLASHAPLRGLLLGALRVAVGPGDGLRVGRALGGLPHLTVLELPAWLAVPESAKGQCVVDLLSQLGGLRHLRSLCAGWTVDGALSFDGPLSTLTALTRLACGGVSQPLVRRGLLPRLQQLDVHGWLTGDSLAAMMQPLLPLAQLRQLACALRCTAADACDASDGSESGASSTSVWKAATMLSAAPQLHDIYLSVSNDDGPAGIRLTAAMFLPVSQQLTRLDLDDFPCGGTHGLSHTLCEASRLVTLSLNHCGVPEQDLLQLVGHGLPGLRQLWVQTCVGITSGTAVALAGVRVHPLHVDWHPELGQGLAQLFWAAAQPGVTLAARSV